MSYAYGEEFEKLAAISEDIYPLFSFAALVLIGTYNTHLTFDNFSCNSSNDE